MEIFGSEPMTIQAAINAITDKAPGKRYPIRIYPGTITLKGKIVEKVRARKPHLCGNCGQVIEKGENYYTIIIAGGGLGSLKFPEKLCKDCMNTASNPGEDPYGIGGDASTQRLYGHSENTL